MSKLIWLMCSRWKLENGFKTIFESVFIYIKMKVFTHYCSRIWFLRLLLSYCKFCINWVGDRTKFSYHGYGKYCSYTHPVKIKKKNGWTNLQYTEWYSLYIIFTSFKLYRVHSYVRFDHSCIFPLLNLPHVNRPKIHYYLGLNFNVFRYMGHSCISFMMLWHLNSIKV